VSFYSELGENDVRKTCVVFYYPSSSTEPGLVYLPGRGPVWGLNVGTIVRHGQDGKWSFASPSWDALIKPIIARAESAAAQPWLPESAGSVAIDGWVKPQRGWLYILDPRAEFDRPGSRVWLFDPQKAKVMGSIRAGYQPDIALSEDGTRLYVASGERESGELAIVDTGAGTVRHIPFPGRVLYTPWYQTLPPFTGMTLSSDGKALLILGQRTASPDKFESVVVTFDTRRGRFLPAPVTLGNCLGGNFVPSPTASQFEVLCSWANTLHSVRLNADYGEMSNTAVKLPKAGHCSMGTGFLLADNRRLALIGIDGSIHEMDMTTNDFRPTVVTGDCSLPPPVYPLQWPLSSNDAKVFIGYGPSSPNNLATSSSFRVFDTANWQQLGAIQTSLSFWSAVASEDGALIYALAPEQHTILVIDSATLQEKGKLTVGNMPAVALLSR
jgi:DNA-binding beta-propeller fold protein YncE